MSPQKSLNNAHMVMDGSFCVVLTTTDSQEEADALAQGLVQARLAACVQQTSIRSVYRWQGEVVKDEEILLLIKTQTRLYSQVESWIRVHHHYETPEILQLPVSAGLDAYLKWVQEETTDSVER